MHNDTVFRLFDPKDPTEELFLAFDFEDATPAGGITIDVTRVDGPADANPNAMKSGSATVQGTKVIQKVIGGVLNTTYDFRCVATMTSGEKLVLVGRLPVRLASWK